MEFALIAMPLILLLFLIVEASFLMKDYVAVSSAVRNGARSASAAADGGQGTCLVPTSPPCSPASVPAFAQGAADSIQTTATTLRSEDIEYILIYEPGSNGYPIGSTSLECGSSNCVKYIWESSASRFRYASGGWLSASVNACLNDPDRDSVAVGMKVNHGMVSGFFGTTMALQERTLMQFEPLEQDRCKPGTPNAHS